MCAFIVVKVANVVFCVCKMFALSLLSSVKQAHSVLRQQRAALDISADKISTVAGTVASANEQPPSLASISQSDVSRLFSQYLESRSQVFVSD